MKYWIKRVIKPYILDFGYKSICEIGASDGQATVKLLSDSQNINLSTIDPCFDADLVEKFKHINNVKIYKGLSLEVLPKLSEKFDCFLIDGDHNWYTVFNELKTIHERRLLADGGAIFFHDVCWPYARRDMYYNPDSIPNKYRHSFSTNGIVYGQSSLSPTGGQHDWELYSAEHEGGSKNGVLTAIEDFISERRSDYFLFRFTDEYGLGVLARRSGLKSKIRLMKWFLISRVWNVCAFFKNFIKRRYPRLYIVLKIWFGVR